MSIDEPQDEPDQGEQGAAGAGDEQQMDFEEAVSELERVESTRRRWGYVIGIGALVLLVGGVVVGVEYRSWLFQPKMPIEESRREIVRETDDPQCRTMIADITNIANTYYALERRVGKQVPGGDLEAIRTIDSKLASIEKRLDEAEALSREATLRFDESREELERWFSYVDNELRILRGVTQEELERLESAARADAQGAAGQGEGPGADAGPGSDVGEGGPGPVEARDGALIALHDAFENFRVWHSASMHPCGDAADDETPWRPKDWERKEGGDASTDE